MNRLIWVIDSPYSRATKWLLLSLGIKHEDHILTWDSMRTDSLLLTFNPKIQVPVLVSGGKEFTDSLFIALHCLPQGWHETVDAKLFRLADADFETAITFFFRANLLEEKFGKCEQSLLMRNAGIDVYKSSITYLLDFLLAQMPREELNFGMVLTFSTILACRQQANNLEVHQYRQEELIILSNWIKKDAQYRELMKDYTNRYDNALPFIIN